jgi:hypothetical protein
MLLPGKVSRLLGAVALGPSEPYRMIFRYPPTEDRRSMSYLVWKILRRLPKPVVLVLFLFLLLGARA